FVRLEVFDLTAYVNHAARFELHIDLRRVLFPELNMIPHELIEANAIATPDSPIHRQQRIGNYLCIEYFIAEGICEEYRAVKVRDGTAGVVLEVQTERKLILNMAIYFSEEALIRQCGNDRLYSLGRNFRRG